MTGAERELIDLYRALSDKGRRDLLAIARGRVLLEESERAAARRAALRVVEGGANVR